MHPAKALLSTIIAVLLAGCNPITMHDEFYSDITSQYEQKPVNKALAYATYRDDAGRGYSTLRYSWGESTEDAAKESAMKQCNESIGKPGNRVSTSCHIVSVNDRVIEDVSRYTSSARAERQHAIDAFFGVLGGVAAGAAVGMAASRGAPIPNLPSAETSTPDLVPAENSPSYPVEGESADPGEP